MSRRLAALLALCLALSLAPAAPRPKEKHRFPTYYPTTVGARWVYDDGDRERTWEVTDVRARGEETLVTVCEMRKDQSEPLEKVSISPEGIFRLEVIHFKVDPICLLKFPVKEGDAWDYQIAEQPGLTGQTGTTTVGEVEEVDTPAGKFRAVRVETVVAVQNGMRLAPPHTYTRWYDPEVGLVKLTSDQGFTRVLKSFTPGKK